MAIQKKKFTALSNILLVLIGLVFAGMVFPDCERPAASKRFR